jgi:hypothetical protein
MPELILKREMRKPISLIIFAFAVLTACDTAVRTAPDTDYTKFVKPFIVESA